MDCATKAIDDNDLKKSSAVVGIYGGTIVSLESSLIVGDPLTIDEINAKYTDEFPTMTGS